MRFQIAVALFVAIVSSATLGATEPAALHISATPARIAAEHLFAELNRPGPSEPFVASSFSRASLERQSITDRASQFDRLKVLAGGFKALAWKPQGERMMEVLALSQQGNRHAKFVIFTSGKEPGKITDAFILPERDPGRSASDAFPVKSVSDREIARLVLRRIDALAEEGRFSGAVLIAHGDRVIVREARGLADEGWRIPNKVDTRFNLASVNKMWTAVVVMKLVEEGKLSLDDTLGKWVSSYPHRDAASRITLRHLLQHRGGIGDWDVRNVGAALSSTELAATITAEPSEPAKYFSYSNAGYVLLGAAAEAATKIRYEELVKKYVFEPAGMKESGFWPVTAVVSNRARGYLRPADDPLGFGPLYSNERYLGFAGNASGGAYSTIDDMLKFHRALIKGQLLRTDTVNAMTGSPVEFPGGPRPARYGYGLRLEDCAGISTLGHGGGGPNSGVSSATYSTENGSWTIIVLGNSDPMPEQLAKDVCELVHLK